MKRTQLPRSERIKARTNMYNIAQRKASFTQKVSIPTDLVVAYGLSSPQIPQP